MQLLPQSLKASASKSWHLACAGSARCRVYDSLLLYRARHSAHLRIRSLKPISNNGLIQTAFHPRLRLPLPWKAGSEVLCPQSSPASGRRQHHEARTAWQEGRVRKSCSQSAMRATSSPSNDFGTDMIYHVLQAVWPQAHQPAPGQTYPKLQPRSPQAVVQAMQPLRYRKQGKVLFASGRRSSRPSVHLSLSPRV